MNTAVVGVRAPRSVWSRGREREREREGGGEGEGEGEGGGGRSLVDQV